MTRPRLVTLICAAVLAVLHIAAYELSDSVTQRFGSHPLTPIEGIWVWNSGAVVAITGDTAGNISLELIDSNDPLVATPINIGYGTFAGKPGSYTINLYTVSDKSRGKLSKRTTKYIATLADSSRLTLTPYSTGLKINAWRLIPYLFRFSVSRKDPPTGIEGAIRIWPPYGSPEFPIVL